MCQTVCVFYSSSMVDLFSYQEGQEGTTRDLRAVQADHTMFKVSKKLLLSVTTTMNRTLKTHLSENKRFLPTKGLSVGFLQLSVI